MKNRCISSLRLNFVQGPIDTDFLLMPYVDTTGEPAMEHPASVWSRESSGGCRMDVARPMSVICVAFSALMLLVGLQEEHTYSL